MDELKLCPFCGGKAKIRFRGSEYIDGTQKGVIVASCNTCGASTKGMYYHGLRIVIPLIDTIGGEKAIEDWNRRYNDGK